MSKAPKRTQLTQKEAEAAKTIQRWYRKHRSKKSALLRYLDFIEAPNLFTQQQQQQQVEKLDANAKLIAMEIQLDDKIRTIHLLEDTLDKMKQKEKDSALRNQQEEKRKLASQKKELEEVIGRHLQFIDTLLKDKASLSSKCEQLTNQIRSIQTNCEEKLKKIEESSNEALKKQKVAILNSEKSKRDSWITDKTKEIKEITIKGLEPEIQKLISKHKQEQLLMKEQFEAELKKQKEQITSVFEQQVKSMQDKYTIERSNELEREKSLQNIKTLEMNQIIENQKNSLRLSLLEEFRVEKQKVERLFEEKLHKITQECESQIKHFKTVYEREKEMLIKSHNTEIDNLISKWEEEKTKSNIELVESHKKRLAEQDAILRREINKERDEEIEMLISKWDEESIVVQKKIENSFNNKLNVIKSNLREYESKYSLLQNQYSLIEDKYKQTESSLNKQILEEIPLLKEEINKLRDSNKKVEQEKHDLSCELRVTKDRILSLENEIFSIKSDFGSSELRRKEEMQAIIDNINKERNKEIEQLHSRVKSTINKRDETISFLKEELKTSSIKIDQMNRLLEHQRGAIVQNRI